MRIFLDGGLVDKAPVEELAHCVNPEGIIVHYLFSSDLKEKSEAFLSKRLSPQKAYTLSVDIARHEHYRTQIKLATQPGIKVIELTPSLPRVTPDHLDLGKDAFDITYHYTKTTLVLRFAITATYFGRISMGNGSLSTKSFDS